ncbi:MAG: DoxX family protein [Pseudomonadales bacterium]
MNSLIDKYNGFYRQLFGRIDFAQGLAPLLLRLYLIPIFWMAGTHKIDFATFMPYENTVAWFANPDWGLGLPLPALMAFLAGWTEILGAIFLTAGFAVRWISIPLMVTMLVAIASVHWEFGWQSIADPNAAYANERVMESAERLTAAKTILTEHGNYDWLTGRGSIVILNNGIEFAATYFIMLLSLFFTGGGRYTSIDYWLDRQFIKK